MKEEEGKDKLRGLAELVLDPIYLSEAEKGIIDRQLEEGQGKDLDPLIANYVLLVNQFPFISTIRSCEGHGYPGHISFRFFKGWHERFMEKGIRELIGKKVCHIYLEAGTWLKTTSGIYFRWNAKFSEEKRDDFFREFINWLRLESGKKD